MILDIIDRIKNLRRKLNCLVGIGLASDLIGIDQTKQVHHLIETDDADCTILLIQFDCAVLIIREKTLLNVALKHMAHGSQRLAVQQDALAEDSHILLLVEDAVLIPGFICDPGEVDRADSAGADGQRGAADGINEGVELAGI